MIVLISLVVSIFVNLVFLFIIFNLNKKNSIMEDMISDSTNTIERVIKSLLERYVKIHTSLKRIDRLGGFESDDEVGFVFKAIKNTIADLVDDLKYINSKINTTDELDNNE